MQEFNEKEDNMNTLKASISILIVTVLVLSVRMVPGNQENIFMVMTWVFAFVLSEIIWATVASVANRPAAVSTISAAIIWITVASASMTLAPLGLSSETVEISRGIMLISGLGASIFSFVGTFTSRRLLKDDHPGAKNTYVA